MTVVPPVRLFIAQSAPGAPLRPRVPRSAFRVPRSAFRVPRSAFRVPIRRGTFFGKCEAEAPGIVVFAIAIGPGCAGIGSSFSAIGIAVHAIGCTARAISPVRTGNKVGGHAIKSDGLGIRPGGRGIASDGPAIGPGAHRIGPDCPAIRPDCPTTGPRGCGQAVADSRFTEFWLFMTTFRPAHDTPP